MTESLNFKKKIGIDLQILSIQHSLRLADLHDISLIYAT